MPSLSIQKNLGAFYTPNPVASTLVNWAVRNSGDRVFDPSCGSGVFLQAAVSRVRDLDGKPERQVFGVEIDKHVYQGQLAPLLSGLSVPKENVLVSDFFDVLPATAGFYDAVVGNPPFVRYQTFKGTSREKALAVVRRLGIQLSELASSWAPFLIYAAEFVAPRGRLAMVVPAEITHASYARPVVQYLGQKFSRIFLVGFQERLFPELNEDTYLLLAERAGEASRDFRLKRFRNLIDLREALESRRPFGSKIDLQQLQHANGRLREHLLPAELKGLYNFLARDARVRRLGELAEVGIGYVTGNNDFFHLSRSEAKTIEIPSRYLGPSLLRSGIIQGIRFSKADWNDLKQDGQKVYLLEIPKVAESALPVALRQYLNRGRQADVHKAYKCAVREPWYSVPHGTPADAFLTYMSGDAPRIAWNEAKVLATNSTHEVRLNRLSKVSPWKLAVSFCSSLSQLSAEVEGHPLGGGMLKLEPSEAERSLIADPAALRIGRSQFYELDGLVRAGSMSGAIDLADEWVLRRTLGLTWDQIQVLRRGLSDMREMRRKRIAAAKSH